MRPCATAGCPEFLEVGDYCGAHQPKKVARTPQPTLRPCPSPGCPEVVERGWCARHGGRRQGWGRSDPWYSSAEWKRIRARHLASNPACVRCGVYGNFVDHIVALEDGGDRRDPRNLQTLCRRHHLKKSAEDRKARRDRLTREWKRRGWND